MASKILEKPRKTRNRPAEPAWDIALLYPDQGSWTVDDYLELDGNRGVEFSDGAIEVLPVPTTSHQLAMAFLYRMLDDFTSAAKLGRALPGGIRVQLWLEKFRVPDIVFMLTRHMKRAKEEYWEGADLVMEVVSGSPDDRRRDLRIKRAEYARAGIAEYWVIDPKRQLITVLSLKGKKYEVHGEFKKGMKATSRLLAGFGVDVTAAFAGPNA